MPKIRSVTDIKSKLLRPALTSFYEVDIDLPKGDQVLAGRLSALRADGSEDQDVLNLRCSEASLPGSNLATLETTNTYHGVTERHAYRRVYDDRIDLTFYVDAGLYSPIKFFEEWMTFITNGNNDEGDSLDQELLRPDYFYRVKYPDDYIASGLKIIKFEKDYTPNILEYEFVRSFPLSISSMPVSYDGSSLLKCSVSMSYIRYVVRNLSKPVSKEPTTISEQAQYNNGFLNDIRANIIDAGRSLGAPDLRGVSRTIA